MYTSIAGPDVVPSAIIAIGAVDVLILAQTTISFAYSNWNKVKEDAVAIPAVMLLWINFVLTWIRQPRPGLVSWVHQSGQPSEPPT